MRIRCGMLCVGIAWWLAGPAVAQDADARLVLGKYRESLKLVADISYSGQADGTYDVPGRKIQQVYTLRFGRRGETFGIDATSIQRENGTLLEKRGVYQHVVHYDGNHGKWFHKPANEPFSDIDASDDWQSRRSHEFEYFGPLDGFVWGIGDRRLIDLLEAAPARMVEPSETIDGVATVCVEATTPCGVIRAWFAPAKGYALVQLDSIAGPEDLYNERPLKEWRKSTTLHQRLDQVTFAEVDGHVVPKAGRYVIEIDPNGRKETTTMLYTRENIVIAPDKVVVPAWPAVPDGTKVAMWRVVEGTTRINEDGANYIMKDGQVVASPTTENPHEHDPRGPDPAMLREMERQEAIARNAPPTPVAAHDAGSLEWILYAGVIVLGLIIVGGWLLTHRKEKDSPRSR